MSTTHRIESGRGVLAWVAALVALIGGVAMAQPGDALPGLGGKGGSKGGFDLSGLGGLEDDAPEVTVSASASMTRVSPGGPFAIAVVMDFKPGWHAWPSAAQDVLPESVAQFAIRTTVDVTNADWLGGLGTTQWPEPHEEANPLGDPPTVPAYSGRSIIYVPLSVAEDAEPGVRTLEVTLGWQACDDTVCLQPESRTLEVEFEVVADPSAAEGAADASLFEGFDPAGFTTIGSVGAGAGPDPAVSGPGAEFFGVRLTFLEGPGGWIGLLLLAALGGIVLNLTPCVLPVIPIKVMTLTKHAGEHRARTLLLGAWMAAGVVAFWVALGIPAVLFSSFSDPSKIFGIWWVTGGIGVLLALMSLGLMGMFSITLPQKAYMVNPNADTAFGSFLFGVMTGVLGLPCFGFVAGALLSAAATWPQAVTLGVFGGIGIGMAAPYLVLAAKPSLMKWVPKTGPASELVKQVMGLLLLAASAFFIGAGALAFIGGRPEWLVDLPWWGRVVHIWIIALLAILAGGWLLVRTLQITKKPGFRVVFALVGVVIGGAATAYAADASLKAKNDFWLPYTVELWAEAIDEGEVVVMDFTAEWCLNCKALKAAVLNREPVKGELLSERVTPIIADLTSDRAAGWDKLRELGQTGIPTLAIWGPGLGAEGVWISNAYTAEQVMQAIRSARGDRVAAAAR
jgi:thiol:disulfide interchange protein